MEKFGKGFIVQCENIGSMMAETDVGIGVAVTSYID
jgi:hypothetical protein